MDHINKYSKSESSSNPQGANFTLPKPESFDFDFPPDAIYSTQFGNNVASSSRSNIRSFFTEMGFSQSLVNKVIEENGEENVDLLLEILTEHSDHQKSKPQSSDSLDNLFDDKDEGCPPEYSIYVDPKEEPDVFDTVGEERRTSLLKMNFSVNEIEFAMDKLGENAQVDEIVDFITAAQIAENFDRGADNNVTNDATEINKDYDDENLYGTMEKTLYLLGMGFSENEVSLAIERFGSEAPVEELANAICANQVGEVYIIKKEKYSSDNISQIHSDVATSSRSCNVGINNNLGNRPWGAAKLKSRDRVESRNRQLEEACNGKRLKQENDEDCEVTAFMNVGFEENFRGKRPKEENADDLGDFGFYSETMWEEEKVEPTGLGMPRGLKSSSCRTLDRMVAKPPYFLYGNVVAIPLDTWNKISQFLYAIEPEFVGTQFFSALSRKEGYIHNLPMEGRFHIIPKPPITLVDALPHTKKWWPSWDTRKQLTNFSLGTGGGVSHLCDRFGRMLNDSRGTISSELRREILHHCQKLGLVWVGPYRLGPIEPEHLELILGYPMSHTQVDGVGLKERLQSLSQCFQVDTLGHHLSVLKSMYPEGITVLSIFSGIGGAEVTLDRLGIHLKAVVSVETSETNRRILKNWWVCSRQTGQLEQIDDIHKLTSNRIERLMEKLGGFDFIICQNSNCYTLKPHKVGSHVESRPVFEFSLFHEFVRVLQLVRNAMERQRLSSMSCCHFMSRVFLLPYLFMATPKPIPQLGKKKIYPKTEFWSSMTRTIQLNLSCHQSKGLPQHQRLPHESDLS